MNRSCRCWIFLGMVAGAGLAVAAQGQSQWTGVYSEDQAKRGETAFADKCSSCHANDLSGGDGPSLKGTEFSNNWNDLSINDLFDRVVMTMPMNAPGSLTRPQAADIVAFVLKQGGYPSGSTELPADPDKLKAIKFLAKKP